MTDDATGFWAGGLDGLVGRDDVLARLRSLLDSGGRTAVLTGIAGAGKTSVLNVVGRAEASDGRLVLPVTCHENDRGLAFGALIDLLAAGPRAEAVLEHVLPHTDRAAATDPLRLRLEVLSWLEQVGEQRPVVVLLDDAHWCDDSSLSVLSFVSHRLTGSEVSLLSTARGDVPPAPLRRHPHVALPPLQETEARTLLRRAGLLVDSLVLPTVLDQAAGNPLALLELARASVADGGAVPSSVETAFREQLATMPATTRRALLLAASDVTPSDLTVLDRAMGSDLLAALTAAERADLVQVTDRAVRFRHPLVRSASTSLASTEERLAAHADLADAYADDLHRWAWHRAEASVAPDEDVARALTEAAEVAWNRGAVAESARLLVRASELSPDPADREQRLLEAVLTVSTAGNLEWVVEVGGRLRTEARDPAVRLRAGHATAYAMAQTSRASLARRLLLEVLEQMARFDVDAGWATLSTLSVLTFRTGWPVDDVEHWLRELERAGAADPGPAPAMREAARAWIRLQVDPVGRPADIVELVRTAPVPDFPVRTTASHEMLLGAAAWLLDDAPTAIERLSRSIDLMRHAEAPGEMSQSLVALGSVRFSIGEYDAVEETGRLVLDIAEASNQPIAVIDGYELRARAAGIRGQIDRAQELCQQALLEIEVGESLAYEQVIRVTMSWVRLAERDVAAAWNEVQGLFDDDGHPRHLAIAYRHLGHYAAVAIRAGAEETLERVVRVAGERLSAAGPYHCVQLARARALLAGDDAEQWHRAATEEPLASQWPFELANAQLEHGAWLRRRHRAGEARALLRPAYETFVRLGTPAWIDLARAELRAAGVATETEVSAWAGLTSQEREVVRLAAAGMTNPEIAATLFLSPRTVSTHLYNAFPKLGVSSRAQLRDVVPG